MIPEDSFYPSRLTAPSLSQRGNLGRVFAAALWLAACGSDQAAAPPLPASAAANRVTEPPSHLVVTSPGSPDSDALSLLIAAADLSRLKAPPPHRTPRLATSTEVTKPESAPAKAPPPPVQGRVTAGNLELPPLLSSPAIERAARAQFYWRLRTCKLPDGSAPPPESITLLFTLYPDGSVDPATVSASAEDPTLDRVADCVVQRFSAVPFRGPVPARNSTVRVRITWPSVD